MFVCALEMENIWNVFVQISKFRKLFLEYFTTAINKISLILGGTVKKMGKSYKKELFNSPDPLYGHLNLALLAVRYDLESLCLRRNYLS